MSSFLTEQVAVTSTPAAIVDPADFDRQVLLRPVSFDTAYVGFDSGLTTSTGFPIFAGGNVAVGFVLPADETLYAVGAGSLYVLVTATG